MRSTSLLAVAVVLAMAGTVNAAAVTYTWNAATGDWATTTNWNPNGTSYYTQPGDPTAHDTSIVDNGGTCTVSTGTSGSPMETYTLKVGETNGASKMAVTGGYLNVYTSNFYCTDAYEQTGGYHHTYGFRVNDGATATISGGTLWGYDIGPNRNTNPANKIIQTGGTVTGALTIGNYDGQMTYNMSGGTLSISKLALDSQNWSSGYGALNITDDDSTPDITVSTYLVFGGDGTTLTNNQVVYSAVEGTVIKMSSAYFTNRVLNGDVESDVSGLNNTTFLHNNASATVADAFEVACDDIGSDVAGLDSFSAIEGLTLGDGSTNGWVQLVDAADNQGDGAGGEVLYVRNLSVLAGSTLDLNGLTLYYLNGTVAGSVTDSVGGGQLIQMIPEPATMTLLGLGALGVLIRRKRS